MGTKTLQRKIQNSGVCEGASRRAQTQTARAEVGGRGACARGSRGDGWNFSAARTAVTAEAKVGETSEVKYDDVLMLDDGPERADAKRRFPHITSWPAIRTRVR